MKKSDDKPLVGFFPLSYNLAETGRAVLVAKRYMELGGRVVFFSHGGKYEYLIQEFGFDLIKVNPRYTDEMVKEIVSINRGEKPGVPYKVSFLREAIKGEIDAFKKTDVKMVVSFVNLPCSISTRAIDIPLICVSPAPGRFHLGVPDNFENFLTRLIPTAVKIPISNYLLDHTKKFLKPFNIVAGEHNLKPFSSTVEVVYGDITLGTNFLEFINVFPDQQMFPDEDYVGIISLKEIFSDRFSKNELKKVETEIRKHLARPGKSILLTMGSSGNKEIYLKILRILNKTSYNVIAVYANILKEDEIPHLNDNILLLNFVPSIERLHKMIDISIIHGGQGTVFAAAYAGKPVIGLPMNFEQYLNLEKMVGHGVGFILSRKFFNEKEFIKTMDKIINNYNNYLIKAVNLSKKLPKPRGDTNSARRILEILKQKNLVKQ